MTIKFYDNKKTHSVTEHYTYICYEMQHQYSRQNMMDGTGYFLFIFKESATFLGVMASAFQCYIIK